MDYLKDEQHYIDRYDLHTIEEGLSIIKMFREVYRKSLTSKELTHLSKEEKLRSANLMLGQHLFVLKGKRFQDKQETIQKWMEEDKLKQDKQDYTPVPEGIHCPLCNASMSFNSTKHLDYTYDDPTLRMMFLFKCSKCEKQQWVYDDGEIRVSKPDLCPKCKKEINIKATRKGKVITWKYKCKSCGYTKIEIDDLTKHDEEHKKWQEEQKKKEDENKKLLEKYRAEFCLSDKEGKEHVETLEAMEVANEVHEEEKQKYDSSAYRTAVQLKQLNIHELEKLLTEATEKEKYVKLTLEKPEMGQQVTIPFSVLDAVSTRKQNLSEDTLKKLIKDTLEKTNWRLINDDVSYRLGYLSGRLKGYEREEDLVKLSEKKQGQKPKSKIDSEKRAKYNYHNLVQLARITGKHAGIEAVRKRRLGKEPDGFFLESGEGSYTCGICHEQTPGERTWWDLNGIRCADCQRNMKEGVFPPEICKNDDIWIREWQLYGDYSIHSATRKKLIREGKLHPRELKRQDGTVYNTIFLVSENQEFFKKYSKKPAMKIEWKMKDDKGNEIKF